MEIKTKKLLTDIRLCLENIDRYVGENKVFTEYENNPLLQDAVERNLITLGEAMNMLLKHAPELPISNARKIVDVRNRLTNGYDQIDNTQIWNIIIHHLPILRSEVNCLLDDADDLPTPN